MITWYFNVMNIYWYRFVRGFLYHVVFRYMGGIQVKGLDNFPKEGPVIILSNHISNLDAPAIACSMNREFFSMAKDELFRIVLMDKLISSLGAFPVKRGQGDMNAMKTAIRILKEGNALLIFPEGTRGKGDELLPLQSGFTLLVEKSNAVVLPVIISGTNKMGKDDFKGISCNIGKPLSYSDISCGTRSERRNTFVEKVQKAMQDLM